MASQATPTSPDTPITIKLALDGSNRRFKLPLRDLGIAVFASKVSKVLSIPEDKLLTLERYSDSTGDFVAVDTKNPASYKQLYRAAKAKQKLRFRATVADKPSKKNVYAAASAHSVQQHSSARPEAVQATEGRRDAPDAFKTINAAPVPDGRELQRRALELVTSLPKNLQPPGRSYQVCCNNCDRVMPDAHFHCSICDNGDFDLCEACVGSGVVCNGEGHWLLKRFVQNGAVVNSTTERVAPKIRAAAPAEDKSSQGAIDVVPELIAPAAVASPHVPQRTCNACVRVLDEAQMITCRDCDDFDICASCHVGNKHGHHPGHALRSICKDLPMTPFASALCMPGRNLRHNAICDACDKTIYGIRHKCLDCPDFDFCNECVDTGRSTHRHRFVKVFEPLDSTTSPAVRHYGVYCDGPLCNNSSRRRSYIHGVRYKCAVCHDFDLCASCEAHPGNKHNKTHPMIKFKTMVRDVSVTTHADDLASGGSATLGDDCAVAAAPAPQPKHTPPSHESMPQTATPEKQSAAPVVTALNAHFLRDTVVDGTVLAQDCKFTQSWIMSNPGPAVWPAGCTVRLVGGDNMLNVSNSQAVSTEELAGARQTNVSLHEVAAGGTAIFSVTLKAPSRTGRHISYWRLKSPDGTPFGHKLWCDIQVEDTPAEVEVPGCYPTAIKSEGALADFQMQLMLLEQQNKKRLLMARQEQAVRASQPVPETAAAQTSVAVEGDRLMVFPQLEKESPAASTHEDACPLPEAAETAPSEVTEQQDASDKTDEEVEVDVESVAFSDGDVDDGFYTDEEYDILDASDEELQSSASAVH